MPKAKPSVDRPPDKRKVARPRKPKLHPSLRHLTPIATPVDDQSLFPGGDLESGMLNYLIYRVGPKSITHGKRVYLDKQWEVPDAESLKARFGGGEFHVVVHADGRLVKGSARIVIEGEPKIESQAGDSAALGDLPVSSDPVVNMLVQQVERLTERLLTEMRDLKAERRQPRADDSAFNPENFKKMLSIARESRYTDMLMQTALGGESAAPTISEKVISDRLSSMLEMLKMGMEYGQDKEPAESEGLMGLLAPLLQKILAGNAMQPPGVKPVETTNIVTGNTAPVPSLATGASDAVDIDKNRIELETNVTEMRMEVLFQKLSTAVSVMLSAIESDVDYSIDQIVEFIEKTISFDELKIIDSYLTFDNVRKLMVSEPDDQISLDNNRERVESILSAIRARLDS